ncbi:MAG: CapA family protein [Patescibacteria group bacterium]|nr:CapA family protein [Patescibacteria group bacterium]
MIKEQTNEPISMESHHFDKRGFLFFLGKSFLFAVLLTGAYYGPQIAVERSPSLYSDRTEPVTHLLAFGEAKEEKRNEGEAFVSVSNREEETIRLGFVGDMMFDRGVQSHILRYGSGNPDFSFEKIQIYLKTFDVLFGNLEGPVSLKGTDQGSVYSFRMSPAVVPALSRAGFRVVSVANNHIGDFGTEAMIDTFRRLSDASIIHSGGGMTSAEAYDPKTITVRGTRISFLAFSEFGKNYLEAKEYDPGIAVISRGSLQTSITRAKEVSDVIVVSFHFGAEYEPLPNDYQKEIAHLAIDLGADLVVGHHPHVVEPLVRYKEGYIAYSLGNFIFDQNFSPETMEGAVLEVDLHGARIAGAKLTPIKINVHFQPELLIQ